MNKKNRKNSNVKHLASKMKLVVVAVIVILSTVLGFIFEDNFNDNTDDISLNYYDYPFYVSFIDVGQGDCELISCNGVNILVDGGEASSAGKVVNYLKSLGIEKLDCYVATHPHSDHIGAAAYILESIPCDKVLTTYFSEFNIPTSKVYERFIDAVYESGAEAVAVDADDVFTFGDLEVDIVAPMVESEDYNDMSIVFTATFKETTVLFTGDTTTPVEKQIIENGFDVNSDIIKMAHHGSTTSNSSEFLDLVSPEFAVISCGKDNSYGHPHKEVIDRLNENNIKYFRTDYLGTIVCYGDGYEYTVEAMQ